MKILLVMKELLEKTDENHPISRIGLISMLERNGISAERKSIYHDIETLKKFGMDIESKREQLAGYYIAIRDFELPELKPIMKIFITVWTRCIRRYQKMRRFVFSIMSGLY